MVALAAAAATGAGFLGGGCGDRSAVALGRFVTAAREPSALAVGPDGTLYVTERATGRLLAVAPGSRTPHVLARFDVGAARGQRGLLGVAVSRDGAWLYADATGAHDGRIGVWRLRTSGGAAVLIWRGPGSADKGNGGHLAVLPGGEVVVGVGGLDAALASLVDPGLPNGKLLALSPDGPPTQRPRLLSSGWTNPFAIAVSRGGALYVADNAVGEAKERIGSGSPGAPLYRWPRVVVPTGLVVLPDGRLAVCEYATGTVEAFDVATSGEPRPRGTLARGCRTALALAPDGRTLYLADLAGVRSLVLSR